MRIGYGNGKRPGAAALEREAVRFRALQGLFVAVRYAPYGVQELPVALKDELVTVVEQVCYSEGAVLFHEGDAPEDIHMSCFMEAERTST